VENIPGQIWEVNEWIVIRILGKMGLQKLAVDPSWLSQPMNTHRKKLAAKWRGISTVYEHAAMSDPDALFQIENDRELFHKIRHWICAAKYEPMESYRSYSSRLSEGERYVILSWGFFAETTDVPRF
jgi:hypothetical protein